MPMTLFISKKEMRVIGCSASTSTASETPIILTPLSMKLSGGREAFAHFLLNLNVSKFVPKRDVPRDNTERREIILHSLNPYDARCWLWDCAVSEQILGMEILQTDGTWGCVTGKKDNEYKFGELGNAYRRWQATVNARRAAANAAWQPRRSLWQCGGRAFEG
jgi:hypothetical protein